MARRVSVIGIRAAERRPVRRCALVRRVGADGNRAAKRQPVRCVSGDYFIWRRVFGENTTHRLFGRAANGIGGRVAR